VDSAAVTPTFTYNNQCGSVLLTSYIPVLIIGYSIQISLCFILPFLLVQAGAFFDMTKIIKWKLAKGIIWPGFWLGVDAEAGQVDQRRRSLARDPTIILSPKSILCFDILNNLIVLLTFGLFSPILAFAVMCAVATKMNLWVLLLGRFTSVLASQEDTRDKVAHFALVVLAELQLPVGAVFKRSFWLIAWCSGVFVALLCWDIAADDVGWARATWVPVTTLSYAVLLWGVSMIMKYRSQPREHPCMEETVTSNSAMDMIELAGNGGSGVITTNPMMAAVLEDCE
jgi:hypothetical protein